MAPRKKDKQITIDALYASVEKLTKVTELLDKKVNRSNALFNSVRRILNEIALKLDEIEITD